ncbi:hypothetical protein [Kitasatospora herbaricolor]|uniref:FXSXX-COOH protein n=1 Tax=Kitasatospora herbaricolor TaxID=68217 RepID=A0ABZ1W190_9ACTN|nr:hypothetical protein [Kitasatospora herbaricolor]
MTGEYFSALGAVDEMTDDDLPALVRAVARLATSAAATGGNLYCWFH